MDAVEGGLKGTATQPPDRRDRERASDAAAPPAAPPRPHRRLWRAAEACLEAGDGPGAVAAVLEANHDRTLLRLLARKELIRDGAAAVYRKLSPRLLGALLAALAPLLASAYRDYALPWVLRAVRENVLPAVAPATARALANAVRATAGEDSDRGRAASKLLPSLDAAAARRPG